MDWILNPNSAYLLLAVGMMLAVLALLVPGTGLLELSAFVLLVLAGWAAFNLPINPWALILLLLGIGPFFLSLRKPGQSGLLAISIVMWVVGSAYFFSSDTWWKPAVNPFLALSVSLASAGYLWVSASKYLQANLRRTVHDLNNLIGVEGEARTDIARSGSVQVGSELWSASSSTLIPAGRRVRVMGRQGFTLLVEALPEEILSE